MHPVFSFIIPHYVTPQLLIRCVDSIPLREDVQVIVVDDCSPVTDELNETLNILRKKKGVEVYFTTQGGSAGRARNIGLDHARGKWLLFVDADDFVAPDISDFMDKYAQSDADIIYFNYSGVMSDDISKPSRRESDYSKYFEEYERTHNEENFRFDYQTPWGKMIRRSFIENNHIRFDETSYSNDVMFAIKAGCLAKRILPVNKSLYVLTEREGSLSSSFCQKLGEAEMRTRVALNAYKTIKEYGYSYEFNYQMFIRILVYNKEFKVLRRFYHNIEDYHIGKKIILNIVRHMGRCYYLLCVDLIVSDLLCKFHMK